MQSSPLRQRPDSQGFLIKPHIFTWDGPTWGRPGEQGSRRREDSSSFGLESTKQRSFASGVSGPHPAQAMYQQERGQSASRDFGSYHGCAWVKPEGQVACHE